MLYMITHKPVHVQHLGIQAITEVIIALYKKHQKKKSSNATLKISSLGF